MKFQLLAVHSNCLLSDYFPMQSQQQTQAAPQGQNQSSAFGDWDIRRETSTRQNVSNTRDTSSVTSFGGVPTTDEDLDTPPFFRKN